MREAGQSYAASSYRFRIKRDLRLEAIHLNISQNKLAELCRISSGHMSQLLRGKRHAGPETRRRIMRVFPNLPFEALFEEVTS
jgi:transcriptional regulator with XRE-family HTH domain